MERDGLYGPVWDDAEDARARVRDTRTESVRLRVEAWRTRAVLRQTRGEVRTALTRAGELRTPWSLVGHPRARDADA